MGYMDSTGPKYAYEQISDHDRYSDTTEVKLTTNGRLLNTHLSGACDVQPDILPQTLGYLS